MSNLIPANLKYTSSHEWIREEDDGTITLGITDHAQELLGDIVYVELPELKKTVSSGDGFAVVESVKAAADVYAPVAGEITGINEALSSQPELMNTDPYGDGWLCRIRIANKSDLAALMSDVAYGQSVAGE